MTSIFSWLRSNSLLLSLSLLNLLAYVIIPVNAQIGVITNTGSAGADNIPGGKVQSNPVTLSAGQGILEITKVGDRAAAEPGDMDSRSVYLYHSSQPNFSNIINH